MAEDRNQMPDVGALMEQAFLMGIGVLGITRDKVSGMTDELVERGKMSQSEAKKVADRVTAAAGEQRESVRKIVAEEVGKAFDSAGLPTHDDLTALRDEIAELRAQLAGREAGPPPAAVE